MSRFSRRFIIILILAFWMLSGCQNNSKHESIYDDLIEAGFNLINYENIDLIPNIDFIDVKYLTDSLSEDYGIIYELNITNIEPFFQNRVDFSYKSNEIIFIYKTENYIFEMYHDAKSTFPGFMRHYDFEANFQYDLFFTDYIGYHPLIQMMLDNGGYIIREENEAYIVQYHDAYNRLDLKIKSIRQISFNQITHTIVEYDSKENAYLTFVYQDTLNSGPSNYFLYYAQYQNFVFIITALSPYKDLVYTVFDDVDYHRYSHEDAQYQPWTGN